MSRLAELATLEIHTRAAIRYICASPLTHVQHADTGDLAFPEQSRPEAGPIKIISRLKERACGTGIRTERMKIKAPRRTNRAGCSRRKRPLGAAGDPRGRRSG